jgi:putative ABC transport system ATP-binding protein
VKSLINLEEVHRDYQMAGGAVHALRGVTLSVAKGEFGAIVGPSGCGKSTLLNLVGAIDRPSSGMVAVAGRNLSALGDREATKFRLLTIGFVFQRFYLMPMLTASENVQLPMAEAGLPKPQRQVRSSELLGYVGMRDRAAHRPPQLSGGEQQRVAIARALANEPPLLLADEPTGELDASTGAEVVALFERVHADGTTLLVVTHDEGLAKRAWRVLHMRDGVIVDEEVRRRTPNDTATATRQNG